MSQELPIDSRRAEFRRIVLSLQDLQEARDFLDRIQQLHRAGQANADPVLLRGLQSAMIVAYNRPFTKNRADGATARSLSESLLDDLPHDLRVIHEGLKVLRDEEFAHTDPGPAELSVQWRVRQSGASFPMPIGRVTRRGIELADLARMQSLLDFVLTALTERWVALGTELAE